MFVVVIDSTALVADFKLRSEAMRGLLERAKAKQVHLVVPEVVVREVVGAYRRATTELVADTGRLLGKARRLDLDLHELEIDGEETGRAYERWLRSTLDDLGASIRQPPEVPHLDLVDRAIARRKPFSSDGKRGYRDALIWETVLEVARDQQVVLLTNNTDDFSESTDDVSLIAKTLRADLFRLGEPDDHVVVCRSPSALVDYLFGRDERLLAELQNPGAVRAIDIIAFLDPVISIAPDEDLGLPESARPIGLTDIEPVPMEDDEDDSGTAAEVEVLSAVHMGSHQALVELRIPIAGEIPFMAPSGSVDDRDGALRPYELDPRSGGEVHFGTANRELMMLGIGTYDSEQRRFIGFTPSRVTPRSATVPPRNAHLLGLRVGEVVDHTVFGRGLVAYLAGEGERVEADIDFENVGRKRLLLAWAPLTRAATPA